MSGSRQPPSPLIRLSVCFPVVAFLLVDATLKVRQPAVAFLLVDAALKVVQPVAPTAPLLDAPWPGHVVVGVDLALAAVASPQVAGETALEVAGETALEAESLVSMT